MERTGPRAASFHVKRLHDLAAAHRLPADAVQRLAALLELLACDPRAPTSVTAPADAVDAHVADSLSALPHLAEAGRIVDIGSGAGFPGLPLAIARPGLEFELVESTVRKCEFIARAIERLDLPNTRAVCMRAEDWARADGAGRYSAVVVRAVAPLATLVEYASPLLRDRGRLIAWKGARDAREEARGAAAAQVVGLRPVDVHQVTPFAGARHRHLHVFEKSQATPAGIPRRAGMARKRPFGSESSAPN